MQSGNGAETKFAWRLQVAVIVSRERKGAPVWRTPFARTLASVQGPQHSCKWKVRPVLAARAAPLVRRS